MPLTFHHENTFLLTSTGFQQVKDIVKCKTQLAIMFENKIYYDNMTTFCTALLKPTKLIDISFVEEDKLSYIGYHSNLTILDSGDLMRIGDITNEALRKWNDINHVKSIKMKMKVPMFNIKTKNELGYFIATNKIGNYLYIKQ